MLVASGAMTLLVTALVLNDLASVQWFFGAPVCGALVSSTAVAMTRGREFSPRKLPPHPGRRLMVALRRLEAEYEIERSLQEEYRKTVSSLIGDRADWPFEDSHWVELQVQHLQEVEKLRWNTAEAIRSLQRERADAHAQLIVSAEERGVTKAHERAPEDLVERFVFAESRASGAPSPSWLRNKS
jgi:hypothetical protein